MTLHELIYALLVAVNTLQNSDENTSALSYEEIAEASLEQANIAVKLWECPN